MLNMFILFYHAIIHLQGHSENCAVGGIQHEACGMGGMSHPYWERLLPREQYA